MIFNMYTIPEIRPTVSSCLLPLPYNEASECEGGGGRRAGSSYNTGKFRQFFVWIMCRALSFLNKVNMNQRGEVCLNIFQPLRGNLEGAPKNINCET